MMEELRSYETLVLTRVTRRNMPEDTILHSHRRENLKSDVDEGYSPELIEMLNVKLMERRGGNFSLITVFADRSSLE
jgi:hypothetical protein